MKVSSNFVFIKINDNCCKMHLEEVYSMHTLVSNTHALNSKTVF